MEMFDQFVMIIICIFLTSINMTIIYFNYRIWKKAFSKPRNKEDFINQKIREIKVKRMR